MAHNCARSATEEEAVSTLFGVGKGVFSGVSARPGLLEQAADGILFLDEAHVLSPRVQRSLLRFAEDGVFARIGENIARQLRLLLVLGTNLDVELATAQGFLAFDLVNRLQQVAIPPLGERRADVPVTPKGNHPAPGLSAFRSFCLSFYTHASHSAFSTIHTTNS